MTKKRYFLTILFFIGTSLSFADVPVTVEVVEVNKIWDKAPHNAFTDLVRWRVEAMFQPMGKSEYSNRRTRTAGTRRPLLFWKVMTCGMHTCL